MTEEEREREKQASEKDEEKESWPHFNFVNQFLQTREGKCTRG